MTIIDTTVGFSLNRDNQDGVQGLLVTDDPTVVSWAKSLHKDYRDEAEPLDPTMLPEV